jgi:hypothetical protein
MKDIINAKEKQGRAPLEGGGGLGAATHGGSGGFASGHSALTRSVAAYFKPARADGAPAAEQWRTALYTDPPPGMEVGLLGHMVQAAAPPDAAEPPELFLNVTDPFCLITVGVQGAGKSHTTNCVLEACLLPYAHVTQVRQPMTALVCHYDQSDINCCEATGLARPSLEMTDFLLKHASGRTSAAGDEDDDGDDSNGCSDDESKAVLPGKHAEPGLFHAGAAEGKEGAGTGPPPSPLPPPPPPPPAPYLGGERLLVLCSPSNYLQRKLFYGEAVTVKPLLFKWSRLNAAQIKMLMRLDESSPQLYVAVMLEKLRGYQRRGEVPEFEDFLNEFKDSCSGNQSAPVEQRLQLLRSMVYESDENKSIQGEGCDLADVMQAGRMVVADLTDPMMSPAEANGVFQVLLATFRNTHIEGAGKIVAFDEAHRYMGINGESDALAHEITDCARLMRHEGLRLLISTQSPKAMPEELLELTTVLVAHRFQSGDWHTYLSKKVPLPDGSFELIRALEPGEALVYSARPCILEPQPLAAAEGGWRVSSEVMRVKVRKRLTEDRGASRLNREHKKPS